MVRIVDEFKDYEEDCEYRPYRPVPRGLITLKDGDIIEMDGTTGKVSVI